MRGTLAIVATLIAILCIVGYFVYAGLTMPGAAMPAEGVVALALGVAFSLVVGIGLMMLLFYSSRRGYDEPPRFDD